MEDFDIQMADFDYEMADFDIKKVKLCYWNCKFGIEMAGFDEMADNDIEDGRFWYLSSRFWY